MIDPNQAAAPRAVGTRQLCLAAALLALLVVALLLLPGGHPARAGVPAAANPAAQDLAQDQASTVLSNTLFLPVVHRACYAPAQVTISGAAIGTMAFPHALTAAVTPIEAHLPVTYTWQATGQAPVVQVAGLQDAATFTWDLPGTQVITVAATNLCGGTAQALFTVTVTTRGYIAFERHYEEEDPHDIWITRHDGLGTERNLTNTPDVDEGVPTWSPDGNWIAFSAGQGTANRKIVKMDLRTGVVTPLTDGTDNDRWPAWSPLGDKIAFMREIGGSGHPDIYLMDVDGTDQTQLTDWLYGDDFPAWSPDGQWIVFSSDRFYAGRDLYIVHPDDPDSEQLVLRTDRPGADDQRNEIYPSWSPDGWIYYTFVYKDAPADKTEYLYRIRPDGTGRAQVFDDSYERYIPSFAPDGQCFVFYSTLGNLAGADKEVWKWCYGYGAPINLTHNDDGDEYCAWSPVP